MSDKNYARHRGWELDLEWLWDTLEAADRGRIRIEPDLLSRSAVEAVRAHIEGAAPVAALPGQRRGPEAIAKDV
jgi:hypothetical protein